MRKQNKRKYPDAMHEAMDIPDYVKPPMNDGSEPAGKKRKEKKNKHERAESKKFERREKRLGTEPEYQ